MIRRGRHNVVGVLVDAVDYEYAVDRILRAARDRTPLAVSALAVHGVMTAVDDPRLRAQLAGFDLVVPDGQPVRWALNQLYDTGLEDRVYGPDLTLYVLRALAGAGLSVYLYGSTPEVLQRLRRTLPDLAPGLRIAGASPSQFRAARPGEAARIAAAIRATDAACVLVGLGCPRQEQFVAAMRDRVGLPLLAVGAAFDYHAGMLRPPPPGWQARGLEWLWRLGLEPRRLWRRYLILNPRYAARWAAQASHRWRPQPAVPAREPAVSFPV